MTVGSSLQRCLDESEDEFTVRLRRSEIVGETPLAGNSIEIGLSKITALTGRERRAVSCDTRSHTADADR